MNDKNNNTFWLGYSDLMTSLFFIMLVLFVLAYVNLSNILDATEKQLKQIKDINSAVEQLDRRYFEFDYLEDYVDSIIGTPYYTNHQGNVHGIEFS